MQLAHFLGIVTFLAAGCTTESIPCQGPHGLSGVCVPLAHCSNLFALTELSQQQSPTLQTYLWQVKCTLPGSTDGVCCQANRVFEFPQGCGIQSTERIARGKETAVFEYPWMALLMYRNTRTDALMGDCGGSLINDRYVLTAAHCMVLESSHLKFDHVRLGEHTISTPIDCNVEVDYDGKETRNCAPPVENFNVEEIIVHPKYNDTLYSNDIALLRLAERVQFKDHIQPICLPLGADLQTLSFMNYTVTGWGATERGSKSDTLMMAVVPRMENAECQQKIDSINPDGAKVIISDRQMCAGGVDRIDSCRGDSGGPLMKEARYRGVTRIVQFGMVSFGIRYCGRYSFPGVYVHIGSYLSWMISNMYA